MAWGKEWSIDFDKGADETINKASPMPWGITDDLKIKIETEFEIIYNNKMPTHDPYTNPNSHIYYQCNCGEILDPKTKSFAALNNAAMNNGWKIRWGDASYVPYCVKCGKDIE